MIESIVIVLIWAFLAVLAIDAHKNQEPETLLSQPAPFIILLCGGPVYLLYCYIRAVILKRRTKQNGI